MTNANFRLRFLAWLIDRNILLLPYSLLIFWLIQVPDLNQFIFRLAIILLYSFFPLGQIIYDTLPVYYWGGQFGKLLTGLQITGENNQPLPFKKLLFRQVIGYIFSTILFGLGFLSIIKDKDHLAWHDKAAGSKVIVKYKFWHIGLLSLILLLALNSFFIAQTIKGFQSNILLKNDLINLARSYYLEQNNSQTPQATESAQVGAREINPEFYKVLAEAAIKDRDYKQALDYSQRAVAEDSSNAYYHYLLGISLQNLGETDKAAAEFSKVLELDPENSLYKNIPSY